MSEKKKRHKPWWWRRRESCPECGQIEREYGEFEVIMYYKGFFECPRCKANFSTKDFMAENVEKWSTAMSEETN